MPTLLIYQGYKFFFYANDHPPAHIHVMKAGGWAKIELGSMRVVYSSLKANEMRMVSLLLARHKNEFQEAWDDWFQR